MLSYEREKKKLEIAVYVCLLRTFFCCSAMLTHALLSVAEIYLCKLSWLRYHRSLIRLCDVIRNDDTYVLKLCDRMKNWL